MSITLHDVRRALGAHVTPAPMLGEDERLAAVAAILRSHGDAAELLLIRRAHREGDPWSGHMALPGGRKDSTDADELATAVRETVEEVGLDLRISGRLIGRLEPLRAMARGRPIPMTILPFVFELHETPELTFSEEVTEAVWVPLASLASGALDTAFDYEVDGVRYRLPAWDVQGRVVWGLTHRMITTLLSLVSAP